MSDNWKECEGQVVDGEFPLLQHMGGSDHSVVFLTQRGKSKPEKAAIKFVPDDPQNAELQLSRWEQAEKVSHPNLIRLFERGRCHLAGMDLLYVVMEYAPENLAQFLPERALSSTETRDMLEPFLETLTYLHGKGLVHGRIRPGNILAIHEQLKLSSDSLSRVGEPPINVGKPDVYADPSGTHSPAGDVWSLGVTLVETLTQRVPEQKEQEELQVSDGMPQPFLDIARHSLRRDPKSRWTVAEISTRLRPPAIPAIPDPIKPAPAKVPGPAPAAVARETRVAAPAKPASSIDPLSVPLSNVAPIPAAKQQSLENQIVPGARVSHRSYYLAGAVLTALTLGAVLAIPRLRDRPTTSAPDRPAVQPASAQAPGNLQPPAKSAPSPKSPQRQAPPPVPDRGAQARAQRTAVQPAQTTKADALKTASERQLVRKDAAPDDRATPHSSASVASDATAAAAAKAARVAPAATTPGEALNQVLPEVSDKARRTIHGTLRVTVKVHVDDSGKVTQVEPAAGPSRFFGDAAVRAAKRWDFAPAKLAGERVPSEWLLRFDFTQTDTKVLTSQTKP